MENIGKSLYMGFGVIIFCAAMSCTLLMYRNIEKYMRESEEYRAVYEVMEDDLIG